MAIKVNLDKVENLIDKIPVCNKPIVYQYMTEIRIYPNGTSFCRSWAVKEATIINTENKRKPAEKKITDNFTNITESEEF